MISMNKGGDWKRLRAPSVDSEGKEYDCGEYCYLHLYGFSSELPQFYAVDSAPGLIIGNGNVGRYLDYDYYNVALFLTRDGGVTWYEVKKGAYIYEIGDHGGLIVIAKYGQPTDEIFYSYDEGLTWKSEIISEQKFYVRNILIEPTSSAQNFVVYGYQDREGLKKGVVIGVNFATLNMPVCTKSDYEIWTPKSSQSMHGCLLGRKVSYTRRKRDSQCLNGEGFERKITVEYCSCTEDDYQCDIGYHRVEPGDPCTPIKQGDALTSNAPPEICNGYYTISRGYRKVAGDFCRGGEKYDPIKVACPYNVFAFVMKGILYFVLIILIGGLIALFCYNKSGELGAMFWGLTEFLRYKMPESYLNIDNVDEDNTLFGNEDIKARPPEEDENKDIKEEVKIEKEKEINKEDSQNSDDEIPVITSK